MAQTIITTDDIDGSPDAQTYKLIDPASGKTYSIDLAEKNLEKLTNALAPFIAAGSQVTAAMKVDRPTDKKSGRQTREYDKAGFRRWAEANDKWEGKRPSHALIDEYEEGPWRDDSLI